MTPASLFAVLAAYLLGSLNFAVILSRLLGLPDPRSFGSGNPGATNVLRTGRKAVAAATLLGDVLKGWLAVMIAVWFGPLLGAGQETLLFCAVAVVGGHFFPVFFGFKGGKGVATGLGVMFALSPPTGLAALATWAALFGAFRISSLSALVAAGASPLFAWFFTRDAALSLTVLGICVAIVYRHRSNIANLVAGREGGFSRKASSRE